MAFKSVAQKNKFDEMLRDGKITQEVYDKMAEGTPADLPERLHPKKDKPTEE